MRKPPPPLIPPPPPFLTSMIIEFEFEFDITLAVSGAAGAATTVPPNGNKARAARANKRVLLIRGAPIVLF